MTKSPCRHFAKGRCRFGDSCRFSHNQEHLPPQNLILEHTGLYEQNKDTTRWYKKHTPEKAAAAEILKFKNIRSYDRAKFVPGITQITFGYNFPVNNSHIADLLGSPELLINLKVLIIKGFDGMNLIDNSEKKRKEDEPTPQISPLSSKSILITNEPLMSVIEHCRSLSYLELNCCINLTDDLFKCILKSCPEIFQINITGVPGQIGNITRESLDFLRSNSKLGSNLYEVKLKNQGIPIRAISSISKKRGNTAFTFGLQDPSKDVASDIGTYTVIQGCIGGLDGGGVMIKDIIREPDWSEILNADGIPESARTLLLGSGLSEGNNQEREASNDTDSNSDDQDSTPRIFLWGDELFIEESKPVPRSSIEDSEAEGIATTLERYIGNKRQDGCSEHGGGKLDEDTVTFYRRQA